MSQVAPVLRRLRHFQHILGVICAVVVSLCAARAARADVKQECSDAYVKTQVLRDASKLEEAIQETQICTREACTKFIRDDCTKWKSELEARIASIIVEVLDASGATVTDGAVSLDGAPWLDHLDGSPRVVSKGLHTLEITVQGAAPQKRSVTIQEGEKNRRITISLVTKAAPSDAVNEFGPWILGGAGVAVLIGGAVTGGIVVRDYLVMKDECNDEKRTCSQRGKDAVARGQVLGPVTTSLLVGGGALVAGGVIWLIVTRDDVDPASTSFFVAPAIASDQQGIVIGGSW